ncbi:MAG TPA: phosphate signaling complex protein PhoU [Steroidobacteraceae bacterium]|jgi:phosphate transport system protein|nr:phosphate signaling complex protein PhoU [Steroidobacteraceae bacterium]HNS27657.1 phosphate signaling complex protein PhoU [Steroidobacteraceae bacterium]
MEATDLSQHISSRFNEDLEAVRANLLAMGGLVEEQLRKGLAALTDADSTLAGEVVRDDAKVNAMEVAIDRECLRILATRSPAAGDLRLVIAVIKAITDLERIGDEARKIANISLHLATLEQPSDRYREVRHLGRLVEHMLRSALDAFARMDVDAALHIAQLDRQVDEEYESIQRQCVTFMMEDPRQIRRMLDLSWAARSLERVGDHATNIGEYVVYLVRGQDIRHRNIAEVETHPGGSAKGGGTAR